MILSPTATAIRKKQQTDRLAAKAVAHKDGDWETYSNYFRNQPRELAQAAHNAKITAAKQEVRHTRDVLDTAKVTGDDIAGAVQLMASAGATLSDLVTEKAHLFGHTSQFGVGGAA